MILILNVLAKSVPGFISLSFLLIAIGSSSLPADSEIVRFVSFVS